LLDGKHSVFIWQSKQYRRWSSTPIDRSQTETLHSIYCAYIPCSMALHQ